jgi:hypothetical protein
MTQVVNSGVMVKGNNHNNTCNGACTGSLNVSAETRGDDDIEKNLQKMIPDGWILRFLLDAPFNLPPNHLDDCETFVDQRGRVRRLGLLAREDICIEQ